MAAVAAFRKTSWPAASVAASHRSHPSLPQMFFCGRPIPAPTSTPPCCRCFSWEAHPRTDLHPSIPQMFFVGGPSPLRPPPLHAADAFRGSTPRVDTLPSMPQMFFVGGAPRADGVRRAPWLHQPCPRQQSHCLPPAWLGFVIRTHTPASQHPLRSQRRLHGNTLGMCQGLFRCPTVIAHQQHVAT